jgi:hypothetical protein
MATLAVLAGIFAISLLFHRTRKLSSFINVLHDGLRSEATPDKPVDWKDSHPHRQTVRIRKIKQV